MLIIAIAAMASTFTACKKDYTCICTTVEDSTGNEIGSVTEKAKYNKKDAEEWCPKVGEIDVTGYTATCALSS